MKFRNEFFYCYDESLFRYLKYDHGIDFICCGLHSKTKKMFWQFWRDDELNQIIKEFLERRSNVLSTEA